MLPEVLATVATLARLGPVGQGVVVGRRADLPPPDHDPAQAREAADQILARPEYQWSDDRSLVERIGDWVADQVGRLTAPFGVGTGGLPVWVGWVVLALLVALVGVLIYRSRAGWRRDRTAASSGGRRVLVSAGEDTVDLTAAAGSRVYVVGGF